MSFLRYYFGLRVGIREHAVCCPFPHATPSGSLQYTEQRPSASVNLDEGLFHCMACNKGYSEAAFMTAVLGCSYVNAIRLLALFRNHEDHLYWTEQTSLSDATKTKLSGYGITQQVWEELNICSDKDNDNIVFPVFMYGKLLDTRVYDPDKRPKVRSRQGTVAGLVIPFDKWVTTDRVTLLCAGEKDMAVARSHGFNAITLTGGENIRPVCLSAFKGRDIIICYDNDGPGQLGAQNLANVLLPIARSVRNCTGFHEICKENKEDITDFFVKYQQTRDDLIRYLDQATPCVYVEQLSNQPPMMQLLEASKPQHVGKMLRTNVQIVANMESAYIIPALLIGTKYRKSESKEDKMAAGETREWELRDETLQDILYLMDNNFSEDDLDENYRKLLRIMRKETYITIKKPLRETIYKAYVTDLFETAAEDTVPMEYTAYCIGQKLESGKKYLATYKLVPHPYKGQQLVMIITSVVQANDSVTNFAVTPEVCNELRTIRDLPGTIEDRIGTCVERYKGLLGYNGNNQLITAMDLAYHTVLEFNFGSFQHVRGYLDTLIVGESRMGKSSTAESMRRVYGLGAFVSLAGNAATLPGLIGGSNKVNNSYQTRAGIIPQNHKGLIVFEELGKSQANIIAELTDIRSSNEVRITRVSGTLTMPATVRMITLSNVKPVDGVIKPIASYPHGIAVLTELIGTAEDIARYDMAIVLSERGARNIDPFWVPETPFTSEVYRTRIRWIWSRTAEQVIISDEVGRHIIDKANEVNNTYDSHIKIFGTEAWKKIARLAIAVAGYLVSTDDSFQNIVVTQDHVDFATQFLIDLYDNSTFKLKQYVEHERKYSTIDANGVALLQDVYNKAPAMLLHLEQMACTSKNALTAAAGMTNDEYNAQMANLVRGLFVKFSKYDIIPTERFRLGMAQIERNTRVLRVGAIQ